MWAEKHLYYSILVANNIRFIKILTVVSQESFILVWPFMLFIHNTFAEYQP